MSTMPPCRPADTAQANHLSLVRRSSEGENIRPHYLVCANLRKPVARGEKNLAVRGPLPVASGEWWRGKAIGGAPASDSFGRASACDGLGFTLPTQVPARHWLAAFIGSEERSTQSSYCAHEAQRAAPLHCGPASASGGFLREMRHACRIYFSRPTKAAINRRTPRDSCNSRDSWSPSQNANCK